MINTNSIPMVPITADSHTPLKQDQPTQVSYKSIPATPQEPKQPKKSLLSYLVPTTPSGCLFASGVVCCIAGAVITPPLAVKAAHFNSLSKLGTDAGTNFSIAAAMGGGGCATMGGVAGSLGIAFHGKTGEEDY